MLYVKVAQLIQDNKSNNKNEPIAFIKAIVNENFADLEDFENEINLFYVAYTRGKSKVINNSDICFKEQLINSFIKMYHKS